MDSGNTYIGRMVGRLALTMPMQFSAAAHTAGSVSAPRDVLRLSD